MIRLNITTFPRATRRWWLLAEIRHSQEVSRGVHWQKSNLRAYLRTEKKSVPTGGNHSNNHYPDLKMSEMFSFLRPCYMFCGNSTGGRGSLDTFVAVVVVAINIHYGYMVSVELNFNGSLTGMILKRCGPTEVKDCVRRLYTNTLI